ncbi:hypothetical protein IKF33_02345 [Candidatus Saccharibacteria bacterium]|nr:hypothetical protein [Candidatus Saccharibacteria bacterium]
MEKKTKNKLFVVIFLMVVAAIAIVAVIAIQDVSGDAEQMRGDGWMDKKDVNKYLQNN